MFIIDIHNILNIRLCKSKKKPINIVKILSNVECVVYYYLFNLFILIEC